VLDEEDADVLVGYDWHGGYGHPDHVKVHHLVHAAAPLARRAPRLLESTMNRTEMARQFAEAKAAGMDLDWSPDDPMDDGNPLGTPEDDITWEVDVSSYLAQKRAALEAHRSQASDIEEFLGMPPEVFARFFGTEHYIDPAVGGPMRTGWPFDSAAG
jgi:LmbE family N-acetylglucosaminyl deacetylase